MRRKRGSAALWLAMWFCLAACVSPTSGQGPLSDPVPAALRDLTADEQGQARALIAEALARDMGRARVDIGGDDLSGATTITVLPPRPTDLEGRGLAMPTIYEVIRWGDRCYLSRRPRQLDERTDPPRDEQAVNTVISPMIELQGDLCE